MRLLTVTMIIIALASSPILNFLTISSHVVSQYNTTTSTFNEETRHSYEFPVLLTNSTDLMKKLIDLLNMMNQSQNQLSSNGTSQVVQNPNDIERLNNDLNTLMNSGQITNNDYIVLQSTLSNTTDLNELLQLLSSDNLNDIVGMLQKLQNTNDPTQAKQLYQNILSTVNNKYKNGEMSLTDYIAALKALQLIGSSKNLDTKELKNLLNAAELKYLNNMTELLKNMNIKTPQYNEPQLSFNKGSIISSDLAVQPFSNANILQSGFTLPTDPQFIEFLALLGLVIMLMFILMWKRSTVLSSIMKIFSYQETPTPAITDINEYGESVRLYWNAVNILSRKVPISDHDTHREYDFKVSQNLPEIANDFHKIVMAYELERYASIRSDTFIEDARNAFKNLINFQPK